MITFTSGGGLAGDHLFGGLAKSKTQKRENSAWDAKNCDLFVTNQRMVLAQHGRKGGLAGDIPLKAIQVLTAGKFLSGFNIQFSVPSAQGVDNASIVFIAKFHGEDHMREAERDMIIARIRDLREAAINVSAAVPAEPAGEDPMQVLKERLANGEITPQQFKEMKKLIAS